MSEQFEKPRLFLGWTDMLNANIHNVMSFLVSGDLSKIFAFLHDLQYSFANQ